MSEPAPGLSLRIRPRAVPPGVSTNPPVAPSANPSAPSSRAPFAPPPIDAGRGTSRPPIPPKLAPPIAAPSISEEAALEQAKAKFKLRENESPSVPPANAPVAAPPPPQTSAPASTLRAAPMHPGQPSAPVLASPLLAPRSRPEDSKAFRIGVKIFFIVGTISAIAFLWLGWRFIKNRYFSEPVATAPATLSVKVPAKSPAATEQPKPAAKKVASTPAEPETPFIEEYVQRLRISGLADGTKPRALIDGTLYTPGQVLEPKEGIILERIDFKTKHLIFRDAAGHTASAKF